MNAILPAAYEAAIAELGLDVVAQPKIDVKSIEKKVKIDTYCRSCYKPEVKLMHIKILKFQLKLLKKLLMKKMLGLKTNAKLIEFMLRAAEMATLLLMTLLVQ